MWEAPQVPNSRCPCTGPQTKACGSAGANESSQSRGLQPTGHVLALYTSGANH